MLRLGGADAGPAIRFTPPFREWVLVIPVTSKDLLSRIAPEGLHLKSCPMRQVTSALPYAVFYERLVACASHFSPWCVLSSFFVEGGGSVSG